MKQHARARARASVMRRLPRDLSRGPRYRQIVTIVGAINDRFHGDSHEDREASRSASRTREDEVSPLGERRGPPAPPPAERSTRRDRDRYTRYTHARTHAEMQSRMQRKLQKFYMPIGNGTKAKLVPACFLVSRFSHCLLPGNGRPAGDDGIHAH